jgi:hypothetical protein
MRTYSVSLEQCLIHVVKARPCVLPNDGFLKQLILYDRFLVDRRRRREQEALAKAMDSAQKPDIPIQPQPSTIAPVVESSITIDQSSCVSREILNVASVASIDTPSTEQLATSSQLSSTSAESIPVNPVVRPVQKHPTEKVKTSLYLLYRNLLMTNSD